jgi:O-antigen/teichoic acid export membrane protein
MDSRIEEPMQLSPGTHQRPVGGASLKDSVVHGVLWTSMGSWGRQILSFGVSAVLARLVGPESFGLLALGGVYIALIEIFVTQGFATALVQRKNIEREHLDSAFWISLSMAVALSAASVLLARPVAIMFGEPRLADVLRWLSCSLLLIGLSTIPQAVLTREMAFRSLAIRSLLATLVGGVIGLTMAWNDFGVWSLVGQQLGGAAAGVAALWAATPWRPSLRFSTRHLRDLYGFAVNIMGNNLLWFGTLQADQTLIGLRFSAASLGAYALASRSIQLLIDVVSAPLHLVALPAFARIQNESIRLQNAFYKSTEVAATVAMPSFCGMAALAPSFVPLIFGPQWSAAVPLFQLLSLFGILRAAMGFGHPLMLAIGRSGVYLLLFVFQTILTLSLCWLATFWSPAAVAFAVSLALSVHSAVFLTVCRRLTGISIQILVSRLSIPALVAGITFGVVFAFQDWAQDRLGNLLTVVAGVPLGVVVYMGGMLLLKPQLVRELLETMMTRLGRST